MTRWRVIGAGLLTLLAACSRTAEVTVGGIDLCFPRQYLPQSNAYIELVTRGFPKSDEALIYVPASELQQSIPGYSQSHPNQYTPNVMHELNLLVSTSPGRYKELKEEAWGIRRSKEKHYIESDRKTGYTRIYPHFDRPSFQWHMALSAPPESPAGPQPEGWYVGFCLEEPGSYSCKQLVESDGLQLWFDVDASNLAVRDKIAEFAMRRVKEWARACKG